jgi:hypothetical protein
MSEYRAYILDRNGKIISAVEFVGLDDEAAKENAKRLVDGHDVELWQCARVVATIKCAHQ